MATTKDGIWTPDQVDDFSFVGDLNTTAATIQSALDKRANAFKGTTSERSQYTSEADEGTIWVDTNGDKSVWVMQGNSWEMVWPERFSRTLYTGSSVFSSLEPGISLTSAVASLEVVRGQDYGIVHLTAYFTGLSRPSGTQNSGLATLRSDLRPDTYQAGTGLIRPGFCIIQISSSGNVAVRWAPTSGTGSIHLMTSYPVKL